MQATEDSNIHCTNGMEKKNCTTKGKGKVRDMARKDQTVKVMRQEQKQMKYGNTKELRTR